MGNETGFANDPNWNTLRLADLKTGVATQQQSTPDGDAWAPVECDTPLYDHHWFWSADGAKHAKPLNTLLLRYLQSAGRGSVLLLNSTPDTSGLIPERDLQLYRQFGEAIERNFGRPLGAVTNVTGRAAEVDLGGLRQSTAPIFGKTTDLAIASVPTSSRAAAAASGGNSLRARPSDGERSIFSLRQRWTASASASHRPSVTRSSAAFRSTERTMSWDKPMVRRGRKPSHGRMPATGKAAGKSKSISAPPSVKAGQYEVRFVTRNGKPVVVERATLLFENQAADAAFLTGVGAKLLTINRTQAVAEGSSTALRATLRASAGSSGVVEVRLKN